MQPSWGHRAPRRHLGRLPQVIEGRLRRRAERLTMRLLPDWLSQLAGARPLRLARFQTIALMTGDHASALRAARGRNGRIGEQDLTIALIAEWESGDHEAASRKAAGAVEMGGDARLRAVGRFHLYLEQPELAQRTYDRMESFDSKFAFDLAQAWRRHGNLVAAISLLDRMLERDPANAKAEAVRELAKGELTVLGWGWAPEIATGTITPVAGRVLHMVAKSLPDHRAGSTYRTHYTVSAQRSAGIDAHVATACGFPAALPSEYRETAEHDGISYHRLRPSGAASRRLDGILRHHLAVASELVRELHPAVLHPASDYLNATVALELGRRFDLPVVYEVRGFPEEYLRRRPGSRVLYEKWGFRRQIEAQCWRRANHIVTLAEVMKDHIVSKGVEPENVTVIPNAVDGSLFKPRKPDRSLAAGLGIEPDEVVLGYVSGLAAYEGVRYLIEAAARLRHRNRKVRLLLVGDGAEREHLAQLAHRLGVGDRTVFTGSVDHREVSSYYDLIDIFVVPRTSEATTELVTPLKPYEAMAMKKALIVSRTRALNEMVRDGETALTFAPENAAELTDRIEELIDAPERRRELGEAARAWVLGNRTWKQNAERYLEVYARARTTSASGKSLVDLEANIACRRPS